MNKVILCISLMLYAFSSNCQSHDVAVAKSGECAMPLAAFKFSYMDSLIRQAAKPSDLDFLKHVSANMDPAKEEMYLWYVLRNKRLVDSFFKKLNFKTIFHEDEDSLRSILWVMVHTDGFLPKAILKKNAVSINKLDIWSRNYKIRHKGRYLVMQFYARSDYTDAALAKIKYPFDSGDVDLFLRLGVMSENNNHGLEALYYYTKAADYGYQGGLVGAALRLNAEGGDKCLDRSAYYILLSGATGPAVWWTH